MQRFNCVSARTVTDRLQLVGKEQTTIILLKECSPITDSEGNNGIIDSDWIRN